MRTQTFLRLTAVLLLTLVFSARVVTPALAAAPANDDIANAIELGFPGTDASSTWEATVGPEDASGCGGGGSIWYRFTGVGADVQVNTFGSDFDTYLSVFSGTTAALSLIECNDDTASLQSAVTFFAESGVTYYFMVNGCCGSVGNVVISTDVPPTPFSFDLEIDSSTVNAKTGLVTLGGTLTCSTAGWVDIYLSAEQRAGRASIRGEGGTSLSCDASGSARWSLQMTGHNGVFKGGAVTITGSASGYGVELGSGYWYTDIGPTDVRLRGAR
jgi:hypothetical protein